MQSLFFSRPCISPNPFHLISHSSCSWFHCWWRFLWVLSCILFCTAWDSFEQRSLRKVKKLVAMVDVEEKLNATATYLVTISMKTFISTRCFSRFNFLHSILCFSLLAIFIFSKMVAGMNAEKKANRTIKNKFAF